MEVFKVALYLLAALTSVSCMVLLFRGYAHTGVRLLLWSALCFVGLSISNVLLFFDLVVFPTQVDLRVYRSVAALALQISIGVFMVWRAFPLPLAAAHNAGAALLVAATVWLNRRLWPVDDFR